MTDLTAENVKAGYCYNCEHTYPAGSPVAPNAERDVCSYCEGRIALNHEIDKLIHNLDLCSRLLLNDASRYRGIVRKLQEWAAQRPYA